MMPDYKAPRLPPATPSERLFAVVCTVIGAALWITLVVSVLRAILK